MNSVYKYGQNNNIHIIDKNFLIFYSLLQNEPLMVLDRLNHSYVMWIESIGHHIDWFFVNKLFDSHNLLLFSFFPIWAAWLPPVPEKSLLFSILHLKKITIYHIHQLSFHEKSLKK